MLVNSIKILYPIRDETQLINLWLLKSRVLEPIHYKKWRARDEREFGRCFM
jgi:hypothetical protein